MCGLKFFGNQHWCKKNYNVWSILLFLSFFPLKWGPAHSAEGCNTAAPAKSSSTLDAFPGSAHPTPLTKVNASPPATSRHPPYDCLRLSVANALFLTFTICFFYWFVTSLSNVVVFALILMHQLPLFAFVYFLLDFSWVSYVTSMPRRALNHQLNK